MQKYECAEQVEAEPAIAVDDRMSEPVKGRRVEPSRRRGLRGHVGGDGMEGHHHDDDEAAQIVERLAHAGHGSVHSRVAGCHGSLRRKYTSTCMPDASGPTSVSSIITSTISTSVGLRAPRAARLAGPTIGAMAMTLPGMSRPGNAVARTMTGCPTLIVPRSRSSSSARTRSDDMS